MMVSSVEQRNTKITKDTKEILFFEKKSFFVSFVSFVFVIRHLRG
jgi:hypothetical protein